MIYFREINMENGKMIILCDKDLYGKRIEDGEFVIEINDFYKGKEVNDIEIKDFDVILAVGKESIDLLSKKGILDDKKYIKYVKNIPYVFIVFQ